MTNAHYENFPVASPLLPPELRAPVRVIYAFARSADDLADEGDASASERIEALNAYERELDHIDAGREPSSDLFLQLALTLKEHHLNTQLLRDLLSAFRQDVVQTRYASFDELLDYCSRSANPVGRIMLALSEQYSPEMLDQSDAICSALQLINFLQDVAIDRKKSRIYIPQEDIAKFSVSEQLIAEGKTDHRWRIDAISSRSCSEPNAKRCSTSHSCGRSPWLGIALYCAWRFTYFRKNRGRSLRCF